MSEVITTPKQLQEWMIACDPIIARPIFIQQNPKG